MDELVGRCGSLDRGPPAERLEYRERAATEVAPVRRDGEGRGDRQLLTLLSDLDDYYNI